MNHASQPNVKSQLFTESELFQGQLITTTMHRLSTELYYPLMLK